MSQLPVDAALERGYSPALQRGFASNFNPPAAEHNPTQSRTEDSEDRRTVEESSSQIVVRRYSPSSNDVSALIPNEILSLIFQDLDIVSSICLGLTCKNFWQFHKTRFRHPLPSSHLLKAVIIKGKSIELQALLKEWMGERQFYIMPPGFPKALIFMTPQQHLEEIRKYRERYGPRCLDNGGECYSDIRGDVRFRRWDEI